MVNTLGAMRTTAANCATRLAVVSLVLAAVVLAGIAVISRNVPASGETCSVRHATSQDSDGRTMWCDRAMIGHHDLVWQYNWA